MSSLSATTHQWLQPGTGYAMLSPPLCPSFWISSPLLQRTSSAAIDNLAIRSSEAFRKAPPTSHNFLLFRLCLVLPWPAHCVAAGEPPFISLFAQLMDAATIPADRLRSIYNIWVPWAASTTRAIMRVWAAAVDSLTGWPPPGYGRLKLTSAALRNQAPRHIFFLPQQS